MAILTFCPSAVIRMALLMAGVQPENGRGRSRSRNRRGGRGRKRTGTGWTAQKRSSCRRANRSGRTVTDFKFRGPAADINRGRVIL
jgi:hypothetical protein